MTLSSSTPASVPLSEPAPPVSSVPPMTTAAIASSSRPSPIVGRPDEVCAATSTPARPASSAAEHVDQHPDAGHRQTHQLGRLLAAADGEHGLAEPGAVEHHHAEQRTATSANQTGAPTPEQRA